MRSRLDINGYGVLAAAGISVAIALAATWLTGAANPKIQGGILTALAVLFLLSELFFYNAMKSLNDSLIADAMGAREFEQFTNRVTAIKQLLRERFPVIVILKIVAGICGGILIQLDLGNPWQSTVFFVGLVCMIWSVPLARSSWLVWHEADDLRSRLLVSSKRSKEMAEQAKRLSNPAGQTN